MKKIIFCLLIVISIFLFAHITNARQMEVSLYGIALGKPLPKDTSYFGEPWVDATREYEKFYYTPYGLGYVELSKNKTVKFIVMGFNPANFDYFVSRLIKKYGPPTKTEKTLYKNIQAGGEFTKITHTWIIDGHEIVIVNQYVAGQTLRDEGSLGMTHRDEVKARQEDKKKHQKEEDEKF